MSNKLSMFKFKEISLAIKEKQRQATQILTKKLINPTHKELNTSKSISNIRKAYLQDQLIHVNGVPQKKGRINSPQVRADKLYSQNKSAYRHVRNTSSNPQLESKDLQLKKEKLMVELKEIDLQMKSHHQDEYLQRIKRNRTEAEIDKQSYERAAKLVQKMNKQRKQMADKKVKETLILKHNVEETLKKFKEMEEQKKEELLKKKLEIQKRIENRKYRALERDRLNKMSNQIIKDIGSYKVSLPDIFLKKNQEAEQNGVLLTNVEEKNIDSKGGNRYNRDMKVSSFLQNIHQQQMEKKRIDEEKKQYRKNVREKHLEFSRKMRVEQKLKIEKQRSKKRIPRTRVKNDVSPLSEQKFQEQLQQSVEQTLQ